jgi:hypothetical protein
MILVKKSMYAPKEIYVQVDLGRSSTLFEKFYSHEKKLGKVLEVTYSFLKKA